MITVFLSLHIVILFMHFATWIGEAEHHVQLRSNSEKGARTTTAICYNKTAQRTCNASTVWNDTRLSQKTPWSCNWKLFKKQDSVWLIFAKCASHYVCAATITRFSECLLQRDGCFGKSKPLFSLWLNQRFLLRLINWNDESSSYYSDVDILIRTETKEVCCQKFLINQVRRDSNHLIFNFFTLIY